MSMNSFHARQTKPRPSPPPAHERLAGMARVDVLLVQRGLAASRTMAQRLIEAGRVACDGGVVARASLELPPAALLTVTDDDSDRYVSRGGLKLAGALAQTGIVVAGKACLDVGQSTGGFTDCLLQAGAAHVVGVDVGHGQLHPRLRHDRRVTASEGINARALTATDLGDALPAGGFGLIVADLSFISLTLVLPQLPALLAAGGDLLLLVKPQFEVGAGKLGKRGIVSDPALFRTVETRLRDCAGQLGLTVRAWLESPLAGGDGNREFFIWLNK